MDWLKEQVFNGTIKYTLHNTKEHLGTAVLPTGAGKSGIMYSDSIWHIDHNDGKLILHFAAPILKLNAQTVNDFVDVIAETHKEMCENGELMFFINSSADGDYYDIEKIYADVNRFADIDRFFSNPNAKVAIVVSCFRSIYKFAEKMDYLKANAKIVTYLDEAHLVVNESRDDTAYEDLSSEGKERWNSLEKLCESDYLYALTATPDKYVTEVINTCAGKKGRAIDSFIYEEKASDLISENVILPVKAFTVMVGNSSESYKITAEHCIQFLATVKENNPNIHHKVLVTCENTEHLNLLREELGKAHYKVFATCSKHGGSYTEGEEMIGIDEVEFIKEVDDFDDDCFVLHIKQLRQGIDIKSLTDCIYYNSTRVNDGVKRTILQTLGRCLRPAVGERGKSMEERTKKRGIVMFLVGEKDYDAVRRQMMAFLLKYYGGNGIQAFTNDVSHNYGEIGKNKGKFQFGDGGFGDNYYDYIESNIEELRANIYEFTKTTIKPQYDLHVKLSGGRPNRSIVPMCVAQMMVKFSPFCTERGLDEILVESKLVDMFKEILAQFGIE